MNKGHKDDIERLFEYGIHCSQRILYLGSMGTYENEGEEEAGTDYQMAEYFLKGLICLEQGSDKPIIVYMNNLGGDWYHGMAIYDAIRASPCHITIVAMGYACSMGSIILQAADSRVIAKHCVFMIHDGTESISGATKSVEAWAHQTGKLRVVMYGIYRERMQEKIPGTTLKRVETLCLSDKIYDATEAIEAGFADWILEKTSEIKDYTAVNADQKWKFQKPKRKQ